MSRSALTTFVLLLAPAFANAQDNYTSAYYPVAQLIFYSKTEPIHPNWAGFAQVTFDAPIAWAVSTTCSTSGVAIRAGDTHLMAAIQTALAMNRNVRFFVDDAQAVDGVCILRAIQY